MLYRSLGIGYLSVIFCFSLPLLGFQAPGDAGSGGAAVSIVPRTFAAASVIAVPHPDIRVDSSLVLIPAHVVTPLGASVTTLDRDNFRIFEDGVEQKITYFSQEDAPVSVGLLFDVSGSMHNKIHKAADAAAAFFKTANVEDEFCLIEFSERPKLMVPFTADSDVIYRRISRTRPFGRTSLLDAIHLALQQMKSAHRSRKAIVIVSDGGDNRSRHSAREIKSALLESDAQVFALGIFDEEDSHKLTPEEQNGPQLLEELAEQSGGRAYRVNSLDDLPLLSARISNQLRHQYLLGYYSSDNARDGKYRTVRLSITPPPEIPALRTYYRHGYYAPAQ